jgi:hypothetical protein
MMAAAWTAVTLAFMVHGASSATPSIATKPVSSIRQGFALASLTFKAQIANITAQTPAMATVTPPRMMEHA